jgi:hypothetical protein
MNIGEILIYPVFLIQHVYMVFGFSVDIFETVKGSRGGY